MAAKQMRKSRPKVEKVLDFSVCARACDDMLWVLYLNTYHDLGKVIG